jgi:hypothetical protein
VSRLCIDTQQLLSPSPAGNQCYIDSVEEFSGDQQVTPVSSLSAIPLFEALMSLVYTRYNAYGHRITHIVSDSLPALEPVIPMLGAMGILLTLTPPGQHAHRVERYVGVNGGRRRALLAGLPYDLPAKYSLHARQWIAEVSNGLPNSRSAPSCADIIVTGRRRVPHYKFPDLCFGHVCLVTQFSEKRRDEAAKHAMLPKDVCRAELAVCLGYSRTSPGHFDFLLENGRIVPRAVVERVNVHPFGWTPRKVLVPDLEPPSVVPLDPVSTLDFQQPVQGVPAVIDNLDPFPADLPLRDVDDVLRRATGRDIVAVTRAATARPLLPNAGAPLLAVPGGRRGRGRGRLAPVADIPVPVPPALPLEVPVLSSTSPPPEPSGDLSPPVLVPSVLDAPVLDPLVPVELVPAEIGRRSTRSTRGAWASDRFGYVASSDPLVAELRDADYAAMVARYSATFDTRMADEIDLDDLSAHFSPADHAQLASLLADSVTLLSLVPSSDLQPIPSDKCKEVPLRSALRSSPVSNLVAATAREIDKQRGFGALGVDISESELPPGAIVVDGHVLYKHKHDGRDTCRIAAMGDRLPVQASEETFASVVSDGSKSFAIAAMQAHCTARGEELMISDADVVGGFLHIPLNAPVPMYLRLPKNLPHPLAGRLLEIHHAIYGLRESNRLFNIEMTRVLVEDAGFVASADPQLFVRSVPADPGLKCIVSVTVDDLLILTNTASLRTVLLDALTARFGQLTFNLVTTIHTGIEFSRSSTGSVVLTQDRAIARAASLVGVTHLPPVDMPATPDFFCAHFDGDEAVPVPSEVYASLTGKLVQFLKTRHDVRLLISHLCSFNQSPCEGHYRRALHVLRYLCSTPGVGCVFDASAVELVVYSDAAFSIFPNGLSSSANLFCIGSSNAPFAATARAQVDMATCPMTAEYYAAGEASKSLVFYRRLSSSLGWPMQGPTPFLVDNKTMIRLTEAPQVSAKMRHVEHRHHYIRHLHEQRFLSLCHVPAARMRANLLTKVLPRSQFLRERTALFNGVVTPSAGPIA